MRGQRAMQGDLGVSPGGLELCVGKFRGVPGGPKLLHAQAGRTLNGWASLGTVDASIPLSNSGRLGESHGPRIVWVK